MKTHEEIPTHILEAAAKQVAEAWASAAVRMFAEERAKAALIPNPNDIYLDGVKIAQAIAKWGEAGRISKALEVVAKGYGIDEDDLKLFILQKLAKKPLASQ